MCALRSLRFFGSKTHQLPLYIHILHLLIAVSFDIESRLLLGTFYCGLAALWFANKYIHNTPTAKQHNRLVRDSSGKCINTIIRRPIKMILTHSLLHFMLSCAVFTNRHTAFPFKPFAYSCFGTIFTIYDLTAKS